VYIHRHSGVRGQSLTDLQVDVTLGTHEVKYIINSPRDIANLGVDGQNSYDECKL